MRKHLKLILVCVALIVFATGCLTPSLTPTQAGRNQTATVNIDNRNGVINNYGSTTDTNHVNSADGQRGGGGSVGAINLHSWIDTAGNEGGLVQTPTQTPTQTTDVKPEIAAAWAGGSAGTGSSQPKGDGKLPAELVKKLTGILGGSGEKLTPSEAQAIKECVDGNCSD